jgi:hypothetical protein
MRAIVGVIHVGISAGALRRLTRVLDFPGVNTRPIRRTHMSRRRRDGAEVQCSVSQAAATGFPASSTAPMMMMGQKAPAKIAVRPSIEKAADTQSSARATTKAASLTGVVERRALSAPDILVTSAASVTAAVSSATVGVTDPVTVIASALRRIRPACS